MSSGNPAGRLLRIVEEAREQQDGLESRDAWMRILDVDPDDHAQLMFRLGRVMLLPEQVMAEIREHHPESEEAQSHWLQQVNKALLRSGQGGQWKNVKSHLDIHTVRYLGMATALLKGTSGETLLHEDQLDAMRGRLEEVLEGLEASDLSERAKSVIRRHVLNALNALDEYKVCGCQGIEEAIQRAVGDMVLNHEVREEVKRSGIGKKFFAALFFIFGVIGGVSDSYQLAGDVRELLTDTRQSSEEVIDVGSDGGEVADYEVSEEEDEIKQ